MNYLSELLLGQENSEILPDETKSEINIIRRNLKKTIDSFCKSLIELDLNDDKQRMIAPFYARAILESGMTVLLSRLDPFRVLSIYKVQSSDNYDVAKKSNVALLWKGDVIANVKEKDNIWNPEIKMSDFDRALLGKHWGELLWIPSLQKLQDYTSEKDIESNWITDLTDELPESFYERIKTDVSKGFSFFSKGVHFEFLIDLSTTYDKITVSKYCHTMFKKLSILGLCINFNPLVSNNLDIEVASEKYEEIEKEIEKWYMMMEQ